MNPWPYFKRARTVAISKQDERCYQIGSVGIRNDGVQVVATNGPVMLENPKLKGCHHAEARLARKLTTNSIVFVARIGKNIDEYRMAKPCPSCQRVLKAVGCSRVYYTIANNEYGIMEL